MNCGSIITREIPISDQVCAYANEYHEDWVTWIPKRCSVTSKLKPEGNHWVLHLAGCELNVKQAASGALELIRKLENQLAESFLDLHGIIPLEAFKKLADERIARSMQVLLIPRPGSGFRLIGPRDLLAQAKDKLLSLADGLGLLVHPEPRPRTEFTTASGTSVKIIKGNLVLQDTDVIVNPANERLLHVGGAAKAIVDAAGTQLIHECQVYLNEYGPLGVSEVMHTTSGKLFPSVQHVLHAVGPRSATYPSQEDQRRLVVDTFFNCLSYANNILGAYSISIPAIGSGIFGISKDLVAEAALSALNQFEEQNPDRSLWTVHFVNIDDSSTECFLQVFRQQLQMDLNATTNQLADDPQNAAPVDPPEEETMGPGTTTDDDEASPVEEHPMVTDDDDSPSSLMNTDTRWEATGNQPNLDDYGSAAHDALRHSGVKEIGPRQPAPPPVNSPASSAQGVRQMTEDPCVICWVPMTRPKSLPCGHKFCEKCINESFVKCKQSCPTCDARMVGVVRGIQPPGTMNVTVIPKTLPGFQKYRTLVINYTIPSGIQDNSHPHPGENYKGTQRVAYLPDSQEGREICDLLRIAFDAGLVFKIGQSQTTGLDEVMWTDIHHKTRFNGKYGYPDDGYFSRVKEELKAKGIFPTSSAYNSNFI